MIFVKKPPRDFCDELEFLATGINEIVQTKWLLQYPHIRLRKINIF